MVKLLLSVLSTLALSLVAYVEAAPTAGLQHVAPKVVALDFDVQRKDISNTTHTKRSDLVPLSNKGIFYIAYLLFGSQQSKVGVDVDTGSSDLWVPSPQSGSAATPFGSYDPSGSSSSQDTGNAFNIQYGEPGDETYAYGEYYTDTVAFADGSSPLQNFQFASVGNTNIDNGGILGVGLTSLEAAETTYPNLPQALKDAGYIDKNAYSLYLNTVDASSGSILFGGKDLAKIDGPLVTLPHSGDSDRLDATLNGLTYNGLSLSINQPFNFDSGTSVLVLDQNSYTQLATALGWDGSTLYQGLPEVTSIPSGSVTFEFDGISIDVPGSDIAATSSDGTVFLQLLSGELPILGDPFLRNAYLVYDLDDSSIGVAKVKYTTASNIVAL